MRNITDKHLACSSLISTRVSSGSGFILNLSNTMFLVTARHVLFNEEKDFDLISDEIEVSCPSTNLDDLTIRRLQIDLKKAKATYSKTSDVAIIELGKSKKNLELKEYNLDYCKGVEALEQSIGNPLALGEKSIRTIDKVLVSNDIYLFGYPTSLGIGSSDQFDRNRPLLRKGVVANIYKKTNTIVLDCPVYPGNSGGPVIQVVTIDNKREYQLIGIVSKYIPYAQVWKNSRDKIENKEYLNSGYSIATAMDEVIALTKLNV